VTVEDRLELVAAPSVEPARSSVSGFSCFLFQLIGFTQRIIVQGESVTGGTYSE